MLMTHDNSGDSTDPEFLTFRHNSPQPILSSGRSIYSQRFDVKSLQKYPIFDTYNSERQDINERTHKKIKHTIKQKHLRTIKSHQKYKQLLIGQSWNAQQHQGSDNQKQFIKDTSHRKIVKDQFKKPQTCNYSVSYQKNAEYKQRAQNPKQKCQVNRQQIMSKNNDLKNKLTKLIRNIKKQQRKQITLNQQIHQIETDIQQKNIQIQDQTKSIQELKQISRQNMNQCNKIIDHIRQISERNNQLANNLQNLQESVDSSQISIQTCRQDGAKDRALYLQLKQGINDLSKMKANAQINITRLQQQIMSMQFELQQMRVQQFQLGKLFNFAADSYSSQNQSYNISHNQSHSHQSNSHHSHSHHSSGGSCEDRYY